MPASGVPGRLVLRFHLVLETANRLAHAFPETREATGAEDEDDDELPENDESYVETYYAMFPDEI